MHLLAILGIALANNLDNTGVGLALGMRRIRLPLRSNAWVAVVTFAITAGAAVAGTHAARFVSEPTAHDLSAAILCGMGVLMLLPGLRGAERGTAADERRPRGVLGMLADPASLDQDGSRDIDLAEATLLAFVLCINNVAGGVSAGLVHLGVLWVALASAALSFVVLGLGGWAGDSVAVRYLGARGPVWAGSLLVAVGLLQLRP